MKTKRTGFTLVELLVVIAIIALLMGILMPALAKVRHIAYRMVCGSNISGIGKAMMVYCNDNREEYPRAGNKNWTNTPMGIAMFDGEIATQIFSGGKATVTSCFYLLIKHAEMTPKQFNCKGDVGIKEMKKNEFPGADPDKEYRDFWDFSDQRQSATINGNSGMFCSYSYQDPFPGTAASQPSMIIRSTSQPDSPVVADRNPLLDKNARPYFNGADPKDTDPTWDPGDGTTTPPGPSDPDKTLNSACHQRDGQNVLFADTHVSFELVTWCGIEKDNIYQRWIAPMTVGQDPPGAQERMGCPAVQSNILLGEYGPRHEKDAWLINEYNDPLGPS